MDTNTIHGLAKDDPNGFVKRIGIMLAQDQPISNEALLLSLVDVITNDSLPEIFREMVSDVLFEKAEPSTVILTKLSLALLNNRAWVRQNVIRYLQRFSPDNRVEELLLPYLNDENCVVCISAAIALWKQTKDLSRVEASIWSGLRSDNPNAICFSCHLIAEIGPACNGFLAALVDLLGNEDRDVRANAIQAIGRITSDSTIMREVVSRFEHDDDPVVRYSVVRLKRQCEANSDGDMSQVLYVRP